MGTFIEQYERVLQQAAEEQGERVVFFCPFNDCPGHESKKLYVDPETGAWYCHRCHQQALDETGEVRAGAPENGGGTAADFIILTGDQENEHLWPTGVIKARSKGNAKALSPKAQRDLWGDLFTRCHLAPFHDEMLERRGIDGERAGYVSASSSLFPAMLERWGEEALVRGGLAYRVPDGTGPRPRRCIAAGRLLIPYRDAKQQLYHFVGYAPCPGRRDDESESNYRERQAGWVKVAGPAGYPVKIYGSAPRGAPYLIITEGQLKAEAALQRGFACIGISGIGSSHRLVLTHCQKQGVERAILLFDTQIKGQETVEYEAMRLAKLFLEAGIPAYRAKIPLAPGEEKADIDSYLGKHTTREFAELLADAGRTPYQLEVAEEEVEEDDGSVSDGIEEDAVNEGD